MRDWTFWEWTAYSALAITVIGSALDQLFRLLPELAARVEPENAHQKMVFKGILAFAPATLLIVATIILLVRSTSVSAEGRQEKPIVRELDFHWTQLTLDEAVKLKNLLRQNIRSQRIAIYCAYADCIDLARSLGYAFGLAGWEADMPVRVMVDPKDGIWLTTSDDTLWSVASYIEQATGQRLNIKRLEGEVFSKDYTHIGLLIGSKPQPQ